MATPFQQVGRLLVEQRGISVVPIMPGTKAPGAWDGSEWEWMELSDWKVFTRRYPTDAELSLWESWPNAGVGVLPGELSGITVVNLNEKGNHYKEVKKKLPNTPVRRMGARGEALFYKYNGEWHDNWIDGDGEPLVHIFGDSQKMVVIPPTIHMGGQPYIWTGPGDLLTVDKATLPILGETDKEVDTALKPRGLYSPKQEHLKLEEVARGVSINK